MTRKVRKDKLDRAAIHQWMWERRDRLGRLNFHHEELASDLDISYFTVSRLVKELEAEARIKRIKQLTKGRIYHVRDPETFE